MVEFPDPLPRHHRILHHRLAGARWIVSTPTLSVEIQDFDGEYTVMMARGGTFPLDNRPYFTFSALTEEQLTVLRLAADALARVHGIDLTGIAVVRNSTWTYADTASSRFGEVCSDAIIADAGLGGWHRHSLGPLVWATQKP